MTIYGRGVWWVALAWAGALGVAHAQAVNWSAVTHQPTPDTTVPSPAPPSPPPTSRDTIPIPEIAPMPTPPDMGAMAGYTQRAGSPPTRRLDSSVSPRLRQRYAQHPGESQSHYIDRMAKLYRETQARMQATLARNMAYIRSLAPKDPPKAPAPAQGR